MATPEKRCDLVMKGGITSGIVYPRAVVELAKVYRFENIGGTSAGAIAAAVTAAAEYGRDSGGFAKVDRLPDDLSRTLLEKFQPQPNLRPLFGLMLAALSKSNIRLLGALLSGYWKAAVIWSLPGIAVLIILGVLGKSWGFGCLGLAMLVLGALLGAGYAACGQIRNDLKANGYGMCSGLTQEGTNGPALTDWLADTIDSVAGLPAGSLPLGVKDLKDGGIKLQTVTTDITTQRPYVLPMSNDLHFFSADEFRQIFPARIVDYMVAESTPHRDNKPGRELYHFAIEICRSSFWRA